MSIQGLNYIGYSTSAKGSESFQAFSTVSNSYLPGDFTYATTDELAAAVSLAATAFHAYKEVSAESKAVFLEAIAEEIMALGDALIGRCVAESALPVGRITGERGRTCNQLKLFAQLLRDGWWVDARIDTAQPDRQPVPKPDIRRMYIPIGPIAVFGASNFPLAFSTAGGDTASALAAGCPVIVKAHPSHPGTNELISKAIIKAAKDTGMPEGVFSSVYLTNEQSIELVQHPAIKAVGFTGSRHVGMLLHKAAAERQEPIPVYAEMSSTNPFILMEGALSTQASKIAKELTASVNLGAGQFCTNPGLVFAIDSDATQSFLKEFASQFQAATPATMLNKNICQSYTNGVSTLQAADGVSLLSKAITDVSADKYEGQPVAFTVNAQTFSVNTELSHEVFGPSTLVVVCKNEAELHQALESLEGQLTATVHATSEDAAALRPIINIITQKAGRIIYGGYPTGVEVCHSMHHGGPFPSTSDARYTSVGTAAIYRFVRPVALQDFPDHLLPEALQNANPLNILRLVNGEWTTKAIA
ncbi:aldehyde dehydrogenase (NADP(+)) [Aridibaculum aurantiacum]|uniref:aldehyde dehydrogenase (NADP(+)) n=1 Tax=Aridibaculum aurantiacum TaxID=2810307 RepID=UPI001A9649C7|nr:aldehyde dehydrogenase (NADP(+)) [Aridibaculum aurantiacum]